MKQAKVVQTVFLAFSCGFLAGCGQSDDQAADPAPFETAIATYLDQHNMAMAVKAVKEGPTIDGNTATLKVSLTRTEVGGPSVTWQFRFEKDPDGTWKAVSHED
jgi:hypothetical protein